MPRGIRKGEGAMSHTFVLVHGAWHGGWCWQRVADRLRGGGHTVFAPTLTGLGERSPLLRAGIDLKTHIADVVNVMKWEGLRTWCCAAIPTAASSFRASPSRWVRRFAP